MLENYIKTLNIEANVTLNIGKRQILPTCIQYSEKLAASVNALTATGITPAVQKRELEKTNSLIEDLVAAIEATEKALGKAKSLEKIVAKARCYRDDVVPAMNEVRKAADTLEMIVDSQMWPLPSYAEMLFLR